MNFNASPQFARWFIIISSLIITTLILWNVSLFFDQLKEAERSKMEVYGAAVRAVEETVDIVPRKSNRDAKALERSLSGLYLKVILANTTIPTIKYNLETETYAPNNIKKSDKLSQAQLAAMAKDFELINDPIPIAPGGKVDDILYYGNSPVISQLKYFPIALMVIVILFVAVIYFYYLTSKASSQNLLWAGMAKETAHQIGTPLSSLVGWTEILKTENVDPSYIEEMTKDIDRLEMITERFSKIGSVPVLKESDLIAETKIAYDYLSKRSSKHINFSIDIPQGELPVMLNEQLFGWTIENLVKNAIDAMKGKGDLKLTITRDSRFAKVLISDTGKGISLAKRIIDEYHGGHIKVLKSEIGQGTTMQISLKLIP